MESEVRLLALETLDAEVLGDRQGQLFGFALCHPDERFGEALEEEHLTVAKRKLGVFVVEELVPFRRAADIRDEDVVPADLAVDRGVRGVAAAEDLQLLVDHLGGHFHRFFLDADVTVVVEVDIWPDGYDRRELHGFELLDFELRLADGIDVLGLDRLVVGVRHELIEGFADQSLATHRTLYDGARCLTGAEPRKAILLGNALVRRIEGTFETVLVNLNLKLDTALREPLESYLHSGFANLRIRV